MKRRLLMFHPIIAPYRIDMVNELSKAFDFKLCLMNENLQSQKFDIDTLYRERLEVQPEYLLKKMNVFGLEIPFQIFNAIQSFSPDVILTGEFGIVTILVLLYRAIHNLQYKVIALVDDSYDMVANNHYFSRKHKIAQHVLMPFIDQVINVEPRTTDWYKNKYRKGIYFPIVSDDEIFRERLKRILPICEEYVRKYQLYGKKILLYVGRLVQEKNIPVAIDAFLQAQIPNGVFVIIGDGIEREKLLSRYGEEESVMFLGRFEGDALYAWYNVAQVFILPSTMEPFGAVTNEALLSGCYSLVSDRAGSSCLIVNDKNGNVFSPLNVEQLTSYLQIVMEKTEPLASLTEIKPNLMPKSYKEYMQVVITELSNV